jgi:hypothetical protein
VDLDRRERRAVRGLRREELRHRSLLRERQALLLHPRGPQREQARRVELHRHVGELPLNGFELGDRLAELLAVADVLLRRLEAAFPMPRGLRRDADAPAVERAHRDPKADALGPQAVLFGHLDLVEVDRHRRRRTKTHLVLVRPTEKPFIPGSTRNALMPFDPAD